MSRNTLAFLGIGLALLGLVLVFNFRGSFVSAEVSAIAKDLGYANVRIVELEAALSAAQSQVGLARSQVQECERNAASQDRALQERSTRVAELVKQSEKSATIIKHNQELIAQSASLTEEVASLREQVAALKPPSVPQKSPTKLQRWNSLIYSIDHDVRVEPSQFVREFRSPKTTLIMTNANQSEMNVGQWRTSDWETELFPRYNCQRVGWPKQLEMLWRAFNSYQGSFSTYECYVCLHFWELDRQTLGVLITKANCGYAGDGLSDPGKIIKAITIPRTTFPDLEQGPK